MPRPKREIHPLTIRLTPASLAKLHEFCVALSRESGVAMVSLSQGVSVLIDRHAGPKPPSPKPRRCPPRGAQTIGARAPRHPLFPDGGKFNDPLRRSRRVRVAKKAPKKRRRAT